MANTPPTNIIQLVSKLRHMAAGVTAWIAGGGTWAGPSAADLNTAATDLETKNTACDSAYATYKQKMSARDESRIGTVNPLFRQVAQAAYLVVGKESERLRDFGLEPQAPPAAPRIPEPPDGVTVRETSETSVLVDWDPVPGVDRYHVYFGTDLNKMALFGSATASELEVRGPIEGTKYFLREIRERPGRIRAF